MCEEGGATHDILLSRACESKLDVVLVQEPWLSRHTKSHPYFDRHIPLTNNNERPRAVTYTKKDPKNIHAMQIFPHSETIGDYCWVVINEITFLNVYKAPQDPTAIQPLLSWTPPAGTVAAGDFNSVHWAWQPGVTRSYDQGEEIEIWAEVHNLSSLIIGEPTHRAGNTLDLVFTNILEICAWVDCDECVTSDRYPISGIVPCQRQRETNKRGPLNISEDQLPHFAKVVSQWLPPHIPLTSIDKIEKSTEEICRVIVREKQFVCADSLFIFFLRKGRLFYEELCTYYLNAKANSNLPRLAKSEKD